MIKIKDLRAMAHKNDLKLSESAYAEADRLADDVIKKACLAAIRCNSPKLERKHFEDILVLHDGAKKALEKVYKLGKKKGERR